MEAEHKLILQKLEDMQSLLTLNMKEVLSFDEAARYLSISRSYLYKLTSSKRIPYYKPQGKLLYFKRSELETWLLTNRIMTKEEKENEAIRRMRDPKSQRVPSQGLMSRSKRTGPTKTRDPRT